jgi:plasmid replication initiation protein
MSTTDLTKRNYTRQSHMLVNARFALTRGELDIIIVLMTAIKKEDEDFKDYQFTMKDLEEKTNRKWNSKQLKGLIKSIMSKPLELPKEKDDKSWTFIPWFSYFNYDKNGLITCRFDKGLKPYLLQLSGTQIISNHRNILPMSSSYSKRMYLLLKEYDKIGSRKFKVKDLQETLKVPNSHKTRYNKFKQDVLLKSEHDINKFTDLEVNFVEKKQGRKIHEIIFFMRKNNNSLKNFIANIRADYVNVILFYTKDKRPIKCSEKGLLYYADASNLTLNKESALKTWEWLHENRDKLECFKNNIIDEEAVNSLFGKKY